jgi:hypothetical protein
VSRASQKAQREREREREREEERFTLEGGVDAAASSFLCKDEYFLTPEMSESYAERRRQPPNNDAWLAPHSLSQQARIQKAPSILVVA